MTTLSEAAESLALALDCPHYKDVIEVHLKKWGNAKVESAAHVAHLVLHNWRPNPQAQVESMWSSLRNLKD